MLEPVFKWTGDPDDEMFCAYAGYSAHVECMSGPDPDEPDDDGRECWYAGVYRPSRHGQPDYCLFHSGDEDVLPLSCAAARHLCELAIFADLYVKSEPAAGFQRLTVDEAKEAEANQSP